MDELAVPHCQIKNENADCTAQSSSSVSQQDRKRVVDKENENVERDQNPATPKRHPLLRYFYKDNQWSPMNKNGKRVYDREFLVELWNDPNSYVKPSDLPDIAIILKHNIRQLMDRSFKNQKNFKDIKVHENEGPDQSDNIPRGPTNPLEYTYRKDQWSPLNMSGKKVYDREFLIKLQSNPNSKIKPLNLPDLEVVLKEKSRNNRGSMDMRQFKDVSIGRHDSLLFPGFVQSSLSARGPLPSKRNSQEGKPKSNKPAVIRASCFMREDIKLRGSENPWKPSRLNSSDASEEDLRTENLYKTVRRVLNKMMPQKFNKLINQVKTLQIDSQDKLQRVVNLVFEKAVNEPRFMPLYALMCKELAMMQVHAPENEAGKQNNDLNFRKLIITRCVMEFEEAVDENTKAIQKRENEAIANPRNNSQPTLTEQERRNRSKSLGNIRFIGELFKQEVLTTFIMHRCILYLLTQIDDESLECLCKLLVRVGIDLESKTQKLDPYFEQLVDIVHRKVPSEVSSRVRFMLQDVIALRTNKWIPRESYSNTKMMDQIKIEAKTDGGGGSIDEGGSSQTVRNQTQDSVETSELKNKPPPKDNLQLGGLNMVSSSSNGSADTPETVPMNKSTMLKDTPGDQDKHSALQFSVSRSTDSRDYGCPDYKSSYGPEVNFHGQNYEGQPGGQVGGGGNTVDVPGGRGPLPLEGIPTIGQSAAGIQQGGPTGAQQPPPQSQTPGVQSQQTQGPPPTTTPPVHTPSPQEMGKPTHLQTQPLQQSIYVTNPTRPASQVYYQATGIRQPALPRSPNHRGGQGGVWSQVVRIQGVGGGGGQPTAMYPHHGTLPVPPGTVYMQGQVPLQHPAPHQQPVYMNSQMQPVQLPYPPQRHQGHQNQSYYPGYQSTIAPNFIGLAPGPRAGHAGYYYAQQGPQFNMVRAGAETVSGSAPHLGSPVAAGQGGAVVQQGSIQQPSQQPQPMPPMPITMGQPDGGDSRSDSQQINSRSSSRDSLLDDNSQSQSISTPPPQSIKSIPPQAPASVPIKPASTMSEEQLAAKSANILEEYLSDTNIDNAVLKVRETFDNSTFANFVREVLNAVVEKSVTARKQVSQLMTHLISKNILPMSLYLVGLAEVLDMAEDLVIDIPKIWVYLAELIWYPLAEGVHPFVELKSTMAPLKNKGLAGKLMGELMIVLVQEKGPKWIKDKWDQSGLEWSDFLQENESLDDIIKKYPIIEDLQLSIENMSQNHSADALKTVELKKSSTLENMSSEQAAHSVLPISGSPSNDSRDHDSLDNETSSTPSSTIRKSSSLPSKKRLAQRSAIILEDYLSDASIDTAAVKIRDTFDDSTFANFVREALSKVVNKSATARKQVGQLMTHLISTNVLPSSLYLSSLGEVLDASGEIVIDVSKIWGYFAELIWYPLAEGVHLLSELKPILAPLKDKGLARTLMGELMIVSVKEKGSEWIKIKWDQSGLEWSDFLQENESLNDFIKKYKLEFMLRDTSSSFGQLNMEQIHQRLLSLMSNDKENSFDNICCWISANVGERASEPEFIKVLMTTILESSIDLNNPTWLFKVDKFQNLQTLIPRYIDVDIKLSELQCLIAIQEYIHQLDHPQRVLLQILEKQMFESILSFDVFNIWESNEDVRPITGKSVAMCAVKSYFTFLKDQY